MKKKKIEYNLKVLNSIKKSIQKFNNKDEEVYFDIEDTNKKNFPRYKIITYFNKNCNEKQINELIYKGFEYICNNKYFQKDMDIYNEGFIFDAFDIEIINNEEFEKRSKKYNWENKNFDIYLKKIKKENI